MALQFEWNAAKAASNVRKHRVSFEEAASVFGDPLGRIFDDPDHSHVEARELLIGRSVRNRVLIVSFTERGRGYGLSAHGEQRQVNAMAMKNTARARQSKSRALRSEYVFDYGESRPNRFAARMSGDVLAVVLEPDIARAFGTARRVNVALRAVISARPRQRKKPRTVRRKAS